MADFAKSLGKTKVICLSTKVDSRHHLCCILAYELALGQSNRLEFVTKHGLLRLLFTSVFAHPDASIIVMTRPSEIFQSDKLTLKSLIHRHYDQNGLRQLCFALNIDFDDMGGPGTNKTERIIKIIQYAERTGRFGELVTTAEQLKSSQISQIGLHRWQGFISNFLDEYLGTLTQPVPFGGRNTELTTLDAWFNNTNAPPYALITAPAGRGKSALLTRWSQRIISQDKAYVIFVPISIRFGTASELATYQTLAIQLAEIHGEPLPFANRPAHEWQSVYLNYIQRAPPHGRQILIIIDGLDESTGNQASENIFPKHPPKGIRVLVSARYISGDTDERGWRRRLGWEQSVQAIHIDLPILSEAGVAHVLTSMANPLDVLATEVDIVAQLYRLSEGDPLLVKLYVDALLEHGDDPAGLKPEDLLGMNPSLNDYFERWWIDQEKQWTEQGKDDPLDREEVERFFFLCAGALGPLMQTDLENLDQVTFSSRRKVKRKIAPAVKRFIIGDGETAGYVFSHSRLNQFFWEEEMTDKEREEIEQRFLAYGQATLTHLKDGTLEAANVSSYILQQYGVHIRRAQENGWTESRANYPLVDVAWANAWEAKQGTLDGFLRDIDSVRQVAKDELDFSMQILCALCFASVASLSANIPPKLLVGLLQANMMSDVQVLVLIEQLAVDSKRADTLIAVFPYLSTIHHSEFFRLVHSIQSERHRASVLVRVAEVEGLADTILIEAKAIKDEKSRARVLESLAGAKGMAEIVLAEARVIRDEWGRARVLKSLAMVEGMADTVLAEAKNIKSDIMQASVLKSLVKVGGLVDTILTEARAIQDEKSRASVLESLAEVEGLADIVLAESRIIQDETPRAMVLKSLARVKGMADTVLAEARTIKSDIMRASVLEGLAEVEGLADAILVEANAINEGWDRAELLAILASCFMGEKQKEISTEALSLASHIESDLYRARMLEKIAGVDGMANAVLAEAKIIRNEGYRISVLKSLSRIEGMTDTILTEARALQNESNRADVLESLVEIEGITDVILTEARTLKNRWERASLLASFARCFEEKSQKMILAEAFSAVRFIRDEEARASVLTSLAGAEGMADTVLAEAKAIGDERCRAHVLKSLARVEGMADLILAQARAIKDEEARSSVLKSLARVEGMTNIILAEARIIQDERSRANVLASLPRVEDVVDDILTEARAIKNEWSRVSVLENLVRADGMADTILTEAKAIKDGWVRARLLTSLTSSFVGEKQKTILAEALSWIKTIMYEPYRARMIINIHEVEIIANSILIEAKMMHDEGHRAMILQSLTGVEGMADLILAQARVIKDEGARARVLTSLAGVDGMADAILTETKAMKDEGARASVLISLTKCFKGKMEKKILAEALSTARAIKDKETRAHMLISLSKCFEGNMQKKILVEAISTAKAIQDGESRTRVLEGLTPSFKGWAENEPEYFYKVWCHLLTDLALYPRPACLQDLSHLMPALVELIPADERQKTLTEIIQAMKMVNTWWP